VKYTGYIIVIPLLCHFALAGAPRYGSSLELIREGESLDSALDLEAKEQGWAFSFHWERERDRWNLTGDTPRLRMGPICLEGFYDIIESPSFLAPGIITERGGISLDRDAHLPDKGGLALFTKDKSLILHSLYSPKGSSCGILWQPGRGDSLSCAVGLFHGWNQESPAPSESWYATDPGRIDTPLESGLVKISFPLAGDESPWRVTGAGGFVLSPLLLPGYAGFVCLEGSYPRFFMGADFRANGGHWRTIRGEPAQWSRGAALELGFNRGHSFSLDLKGLAYLPGVFQTPPGQTPDGEPIKWKGEGKLTGGPLYLRGEGDGTDRDDPPANRLALGSGGRWGNWGASGELCRLWEEDREVIFSGKAFWRHSALTLEGQIRLEWSGEEGGTPEEYSWQSGAALSLRGGGLFAIRLKGEGEENFPSPETIRLEVAFRSGK